MAYGLITKNANGEIQINSEDPALVLYEKRTETIPTGMYYWTDSIANTSDGPLLLAFNPLSVPLFHIGWVYNNGTYEEARFAQSPPGYGTYYLNYLIFMLVNKFAAGGENYGIRVYDANGNIVFRDDLDTMRVVGLYSGSQASDQNVDINVHNADQNYFAAFPRGYHVESFYDYDNVYERTLKKVDSTTIRLTRSFVEKKSSAGDSGWISNYTVVEIEPPN